MFRRFINVGHFIVGEKGKVITVRQPEVIKPRLTDDAFDRAEVSVKNGTVYGNKIDASMMKPSELDVYARSFSHGCVVGEVFYEGLLKAENVETLKQNWHICSESNEINYYPNSHSGFKYSDNVDIMAIEFSRTLYFKKAGFRNKDNELVPFLLSADAAAFKQGLLFQRQLAIERLKSFLGIVSEEDVSKFDRFIKNHPLVKEIEKASLHTLISECFTEEEKLHLLRSLKTTGGKHFHELVDEVLVLAKNSDVQFIHPSILASILASNPKSPLYRHADMYLLEQFSKNLRSFDYKNVSYTDESKIVKSMESVSSRSYNAAAFNISKGEEVSHLENQDNNKFRSSLEIKASKISQEKGMDIVLSSVRDTTAYQSDLKSKLDEQISRAISSGRCSLAELALISSHFTKTNRASFSFPNVDRVTVTLPNQKDIINEFNNQAFSIKKSISESIGDDAF
jgi:hypothetical protein